MLRENTAVPCDLSPVCRRKRHIIGTGTVVLFGLWSRGRSPGLESHASYSATPRKPHVSDLQKGWCLLQSPCVLWPGKLWFVWLADFLKFFFPFLAASLVNIKCTILRHSGLFWPFLNHIKLTKVSELWGGGGVVNCFKLLRDFWLRTALC